MWKCTKCSEEVEDSFDVCWNCGTSKEGVENPHFLKPESETRTEPDQPVQEIPVGNACPSCGGSNFKKVRPKSWVAFISDRVCRDCKTRYTPPTPIWAGVVFILIGLLLGGLGLLGVISRISNPNPLTLPAVAIEIGLGIVGLLAIVHGARCLTRPGKV